jgi:hypothetical protein
MASGRQEDPDSISRTRSAGLELLGALDGVVTFRGTGYALGADREDQVARLRSAVESFRVAVRDLTSNVMFDTA